MAIDILNIISGVSEYAKPNRYQVDVIPPSTLLNGTQEKESDDFFGTVGSIITDATAATSAFLDGESRLDQRAVNLSCSATTMPGVSYATKDMRAGNGPLRKIAYDKIYEPVTLTFYLDIEHMTRRFFTDWINSIDNPSGMSNGYHDGNSYSYYADYIGSIYMYQLDNNMIPSSIIYMSEVYPTAVSEVSFAYDNGDQISTFNVTFTYRDWVNKKVNRQLSRILDTGRTELNLF